MLVLPTLTNSGGAGRRACSTQSCARRRDLQRNDTD